MCLVVHLMVATSKYFSVNQSALMVCFQLQFSAAGNATVSTYTREQNVQSNLFVDFTLEMVVNMRLEQS